MREEQINKTVFRAFDSVDELVETALAIPASRVGDHVDLGMAGWIGRTFGDFEAVRQAAGEAWSTGLRIVDRMLAEIDAESLPKPTSRRRRMRFAEDDGDELDYDRLRTGQPYWRTSRRENTRGPATITVIVDVSAKASVSSTDILWRGAAAIALAIRLEEAGYRVELWAVHNSKKVWASNGRYDIHGCTGICLKRPDEPLDRSTLVAAVSGWFYRTIFHRARCLGDLRVHDGLGQPGGSHKQGTRLDHPGPQPDADCRGVQLRGGGRADSPEANRAYHYLNRKENSPCLPKPT